MSAPQMMFDVGARSERVIWIPGALSDCESPSPDFKDFCEDMPDDEAHALFQQLPILKQFSQGYPDPAEVAEILAIHGIEGFLLQGASPVRRYLPGGLYMSGWGHYRTRWFYAKTIEEAAQLCVEWAETQAAQDRGESQ